MYGQLFVPSGSGGSGSGSGSGLWELLDEQILLGDTAQMDFESGYDDAVYASYRIELLNFRPTVAAQIYFNTKRLGQASYDTTASDYSYWLSLAHTQAAPTYVVGANGSNMFCTGGSQSRTTTHTPASFHVEFENLSATDRWKILRFSGQGGAVNAVSNAVWGPVLAHGNYRVDNSALIGIRARYSDGSIRAGAIGRLYGLKKAA